MLFGDKILRLRKFVGLLQKELGDEIGVKESRISEYETDVYTPSAETLFAISKVCGMHVGYFFDDLTPEEYYGVTKDLKYAYYLSTLPADVRRYQRKMLKRAYQINRDDLDKAGKEILKAKTKVKAPRNAKRRIMAFHEDYFKELKKRSLAQFEKAP